MKKRGLGTKGLVILLVAATVVFCAALRSISHSYYTSAATMHAEGTVVAFDTAANLGQTDLSGRYVLELENDPIQYTFTAEEGAKIAEELQVGETVSLQYERSTFHTVVQLQADSGSGEDALHYQLHTIADQKRTQARVIAAAVYAVFVILCIGAFVRGKKKRRA